MPSSLLPLAPLALDADPLEKHAERAKQVQIDLAREAGEFEGVRRDARPLPRIRSNMAACILPGASVPR